MLSGFGASYPEWLINTGFVWPVFAGIGAAVWLLVRRELRRFRADMVEQVVKQTAQIQPDANGGKSLPDLHKKVDKMSGDLAELRGAFSQHVREHSR